jgi:hypothetical protein
METNSNNDDIDNSSNSNPVAPPTNAPLQANVEINGHALRGEDVVNAVERVKLAAIFIILLIIKFLLDNILKFVVIVAAYATYFRIINSFNEQIAMKSRCSIRVLLANFSLCVLMCVYMWMVSSYLFSSEHFLPQRLSYRVDESEKLGCVDTLWRVAFADVAVQFGVESIKLTYFILSTCTYKQFLGTIPSQYNFCGLNSHRDVERGSNGNSRPRALPTSPRSDNQSSDFLNTLSSIFFESSFRRREHAAGAGENENMLPHTREDIEGGRMPPSTSTSDSDQDGVEDVQLECARLLRLRRICTIISIIALTYRSTLPLPLWILYLSQGSSMTKSFLPFLYAMCKMSDISLKIFALVEAFGHLFMGNIVSGNPCCVVY